MAKFYFTYGSDKRFPFRYGWTEIEAPDMATACAAFRLFHPDRDPDSKELNCANFYTEEEFKATEMYKKGNCYGTRCHERIALTLTREVFTEKGNKAPLPPAQDYTREGYAGMWEMINELFRGED